MDIFGINIPIPVAFFGGIGLIVVVTGIFLNLRWALLAFMLMLFASSISYTVDPYTDELLPTVFMDLQLARTVLYIIGGCLCYLVIAAHAGEFVPNSINAIGVLLASIALYGSVGRILAGNIEAGFLSVGLAVLSVTPLVIVAPNLMTKRSHAITLMRSVVLVMAFWILLNAIQYVVEPWKLYPGGSKRFQGLTANPQFVAVMCAFSSVTCLWVGLNDKNKLFRIFAIGVSTVMLVCLVWSGSRTGFGMFVIGSGFILAARAGQAILLAPVAAIVGMLVLNVVLGTGDVNFDPGRLINTENTRGTSWSGLFRTFLENPLLGTGDPNRARGSENSYLLALAAHGIFMGVLVFALMGACIILCLKLLRRRRYEDKFGKALTDLAMGGMAMYFAGGLLEGYIISRVHSATVFLVLCATIGRRVLDTRPDEQHALEEATTDEEYAEDDWHDAPLPEPVERDDSGYADEAWDEPEEHVWNPDEDWREHPRRRRETTVRDD